MALVVGERSFVKAAHGYLVELGVRDGHADELSILERLQ